MSWCVIVDICVSAENMRDDTESVGFCNAGCMCVCVVVSMYVCV